MTDLCIVYRLGMIPYRQAWELQEKLAGQIAAGEHPPALLLLQHPHTYTFGRRGQLENLLLDETELKQRGIEVVWADRGGDVTYHGPGQLVGYPLLPLAPGGLYAARSEGKDPTASVQPGTPSQIESSEFAGVIAPANQADLDGAPEEAVSQDRLPKADYIGYLRRLENVLILALFNLGLPAGQVNGLTGVWVQPDVLSRCLNCAPDKRQRPAKIAAIGVKVDARGVSRHGFALNVEPDMSYWDGIIGCGLADYGVTSVAELTPAAPDMARIERETMAAFGRIFEYDIVEKPPDHIRRMIEAK